MAASTVKLAPVVPLKKKLVVCLHELDQFIRGIPLSHQSPIKPTREVCHRWIEEF